jgi:hypothetical protein
MPNPTVAVQGFTLAVTNEEFDVGLDSVVGDYQTNEMIMQVSSGFGQRCDDTQPGKFLGIVSDSIKKSVLTGDIAGLRIVRVQRPAQGFSVKIASALPTDIGRPVYARFSNEASFLPGSNANFIGYVKAVGTPANPTIGQASPTPATQILVVPPPWDLPLLAGVFQLPSGAVTLSYLHMRKLIEWNGTSSTTCTLPPIASVGVGDETCFKVTGTNATFTLTLQGSGTDLIEFGASLTLGTARGSTAKIMSDGTQWVLVGKI